MQISVSFIATLVAVVASNPAAHDLLSSSVDKRVSNYLLSDHVPTVVMDIAFSVLDANTPKEM